jgi:hypothetical protein
MVEKVWDKEFAALLPEDSQAHDIFSKNGYSPVFSNSS